MGDDTGKIEISGGAYAVKPDDSYILNTSTVARFTTGSASSFLIGTPAEIEDAVKNAGEGDEIEILQGDADMIVPDGVSIINSSDGNVTVNGEAIDKDDVIVTHTHDGKKVEAKAPSCDKTGNIAYWYCEGCGKYFSDEAMTTEITAEQTLIKTIPHTAVKVNAKEAAPDKTGNIEFWYCSVCGKYFSDEAMTKEITKESTVIPATGKGLAGPAKTNPQTGDSAGLVTAALAALLLSGALMGTALYRKKKA